MLHFPTLLLKVLLQVKQGLYTVNPVLKWKCRGETCHFYLWIYNLVDKNNEEKTSQMYYVSPVIEVSE